MENYPDYETVDYHVVYGELIRVARQRTTITYGELAGIVGLPPTGNHMSKRTGAIVGAISQNEFDHGRPMLSAVVVKQEGAPGDGFFKLARQLGLLASENQEAQRAFWKTQQEQVYQTWQPKVYNP